MKHGSDDMPIACRLTSAELYGRAATLLAYFLAASCRFRLGCKQNERNLRLRRIHRFPLLDD